VVERLGVSPRGCGGSIPTPPLQVQVCDVACVQEIIERVHYSHSIFGVTATICYGVWAAVGAGYLFGGPIVGGAIFGEPAAYNVKRKYANGAPLLELRRFVLEDHLPKNSESRYLAVMLRDLKRRGVRRVLSYADPAYGHSGVIYSASGFQRMGVTAARKHIDWRGKRYPDRNLHQVNFPFHKELRAALASGEASLVSIPGKIVWLREL
jgi:hypothetical protein